MADTDPSASWVPLEADERRVLGVLVEKAKTTPETYPLTLAATVTGCNQKSNRDPVTSYDADDVEETLNRLRKKGAVVMVESGGRVVRYKHTLYDWLKVNKVELAIMAELLLRGSQTEGELRGRASRMEPLPDLSTLQTFLQSLEAKGLVVYLTPPGTRRGVIVTHNLYLPKELERERQRSAAGAIGEPDPADRPAPPARGQAHQPTMVAADSAAIDALREELNRLREQVIQLAAEVQGLKDALGS